MHDSGAPRREVANAYLETRIWSWLFEILKLVCVCEALLSLLHKTHPSCPDLIRASINLRKRALSKKMDHRVIKPGDDDLVQATRWLAMTQARTVDRAA